MGLLVSSDSSGLGNYTLGLFLTGKYYTFILNSVMHCAVMVLKNKTENPRTRPWQCDLLTSGPSCACNLMSVDFGLLGEEKWFLVFRFTQP